MAAVVERSSFVPLPRTRFTAMVAAADPHRRAHLAGRLRSLGAGAVVEAGTPHEARSRSRMTTAQDVCVIDPADPAMVELGLLEDLGRAGWRRIVVVAGDDSVTGVLTALGRGVRSYVAVASTHPEPAAPPPRGRPHVRGGGPDELSPREVEVLQHVAEGRSNREIGDLLGLSALTVKSHLARIGRKLGTGDRAEMVAIGFRDRVLR